MVGAASASASATGIPMHPASQNPWAATAAALRSSPRPVRKATRDVVPNDRKLNTQNDAVRTLAASASPARGVTPRWPTMPVSTSV